MQQFVILLIATAVSISGYGEDIPLEYQMQEGVTFCLDFNQDTVVASRAGGDIQPLKTPNGVSFEGGVKGKAIKSMETGINLSFRLKDNLSFEKPGSLGIWIRPLKWKYPQDMPELKNGLKQQGYYPFFSTNYQKGYIGVQRISSHKVGNSDIMHLWFNGLEGINAAGKKAFVWTDGSWHNLVITWDPLEFKIFIDGELQTAAIIQRKIKNEEVSEYFTVSVPPNTMIDEFVIYNRLLSADEIKKYFEFMKTKGSDI